MIPSSNRQQLREDLWRRSIQKRRGTFEDPNAPVKEDPDPIKEYLYQQGPPVQARAVIPEDQYERLQLAGQDFQTPYQSQLGQIQQTGQNALRAAVARRAFAEEDKRRQQAAEQEYQRRTGQMNAQAMMSANAGSNYQSDPNNPWRLPLDKFTVTARYGQTGKMWKSSHGGIDLAAPTGTPVRPVRPGVVTKVENHPAFGNVVWVDNGEGVTTRYGHLSQFGNFRAGQNVGYGDTIGYVGTTGNSTGPHLHLGFYNGQGQTMNPENYIGNLL